jgi:hypothetical protein
MRTVKSAAVQLRPVLYSREGTVDRRAVRHFLPKGWCLTAKPTGESAMPYSVCGRDAINLA